MEFADFMFGRYKMPEKIYACNEVPIDCKHCNSYDCDRRAEKFNPEPREKFVSLEDQVLRFVAANAN